MKRKDDHPIQETPALLYLNGNEVAKNKAEVIK